MGNSVKFIFVLLLVAFATDALACFSPPEGLVEKHQSQALFAFIVAIIFLVSSLVLRFYSNLKRVWVPLLFITSFTYIPGYLWHWGQFSGSCGSPEIVFAFRVWAGGMLALFIYEVFNFFKIRKTNAT